MKKVKLWGLYTKDSNHQLPLKSLDISIKIIHNVVNILYSQTYYNDSDSLLETEFFFSICPNACFDAFEAVFNKTSIKCIVKKKEEAKEQYEQAIQQKKFAAYSEINGKTGDIMKIIIGNIPKKTDVLVKYSCIQKLEIELNKFWCFRLFSTLTSRYSGEDLRSTLDNDDNDIDLLRNYPTILQNHNDAYPWNIQAEIQSPSPITSLFSPSHDILTNYGNEKHTCTITLNPQSKHFPNKDFVLLYSNGREDKLDYLLTPFEDGYCAMVSLLADFDDKITQNEVYDNFVKAKETENNHTMSKVRGEYIFLIDRSGSMKGERITMAKKSLILFLKSLPKDSLFNVVSFGTRYSFMHSSSQTYSSESLDLTIDKVEQFQADMGGTEILSALNEAFCSVPLKKGYPRFIFLLTDGAVSNTKRVLDLIRSNNENARTFTIGVGNGCSPELIINGAINGKGKHEFVVDNNQIYDKVISLLNASLSPCYSDFSLHANNFDAVVQSVSPNPNSIPFLINGQAITFFLFLRNEAFQANHFALKLSMYDSTIQGHRNIEIALDKSQAIENKLIPKLGIFDIIKKLEAQTEVSENDNEPRITWLAKQDIKQVMLDYSVKYDILCKETAFFCEITSSDIKSGTPTKVVIPAISSIDYWIKKRNKNKHISFDMSVAIHDVENWKSYQQADMSVQTATFIPRINCSCGLMKVIRSLFSKKQQPVNIIVNKSSVDLKPALRTSSIHLNDLEIESISHVNPKEFAPEASSKAMTNNNQYFDVIVNQKFDGYWDPTDDEVRKKVFKEKKLPELPQEIIITKESSSKDTVWTTVLVLLWLELAFKKDRKAWILIHQKGTEWLKGQGVDYESAKKFGTSFIQMMFEGPNNN